MKVGNAESKRGATSRGLWNFKAPFTKRVYRSPVVSPRATSAVPGPIVLLQSCLYSRKQLGKDHLFNMCSSAERTLYICFFSLPVGKVGLTADCLL